MTSKQNPSSDSPSIRPLLEDTIADIVHSMVFPPERGAEGLFSVKEIADLIFKSDRHARRYIDGEVPYTGLMFIRLAQAAYAKGDTRLMDLVKPEGYVLSPSHDVPTNDSLDDELAEEQLYSGRMREAYERGDVKDARKWKKKKDEISNRIDRELAKKGGSR